MNILSDVQTAPPRLTHELVQRVLAGRGLHDVDLERATPSLAGISRALRSRGISARVARVRPEDWPRLDLPALIELPDGRVGALRELRKRYAVLEHESGLARYTLDGSFSFSTGRVLDISGRFPRQGRLIFRLLRASLSERKTWLHVAVWSVWLAFAGLAAPLAARSALDHALPEGASAWLTTLAVAMALVAVARAWFGYLRDEAFRHLLGRTQARVLSSVFEHALLRPYSAQRNDDVGTMTQLMASSAHLSELFAGPLLSPLIDGSLLVVYGLMLASEIPGAALWVLAVAVVGLSVAAVFAYRHAEIATRELRASAGQRERLFDLVSGAETLRVAGAQREGVARWLGLLLDERGLTLARERTGVAADLTLEATRQAIVLGVFAWGGYACLQGRVSVGGFVACAMLADQVSLSLIGMGRSLLPLASAEAHIARVERVLAQPTEAAPIREAQNARALAPSIELDDLWFRYAPELPWVQEGYSARIEAGQHLTLRASSGSGKSTLLRIIAGLLAPERGSVRIGGRSSQEARHHIAYLPQDTYLFEGSVLDNLLLLSGASATSVLEAAHATGLQAWVEQLPMGYDTLLPPGGGNVSGGQRQLIRITAALASERPVLLLDEALSQLDALAQKRVLESASFAHKTVISVSHDGPTRGTRP